MIEFKYQVQLSNQEDIQVHVQTEDHQEVDVLVRAEAMILQLQKSREARLQKILDERDEAQCKLVDMALELEDRTRQVLELEEMQAKLTAELDRFQFQTSKFTTKNMTCAEAGCPRPECQ